MATCSGGEQKRLALEALLRGDAAVLLLDEPDNFLDVPGKRWLEDELRRSPKTILFVSHDRELLAGVATKIVTVEAKGTWTHGGGFASYHDARDARNERLARDAAQWEDERARLVELVREMRQRAKISDGVRAQAQGGRDPPPALRGADQAPGARAGPAGRRPPRAAGAPGARRS